MKGKKIFTGSANLELAGKICDYLDHPLGKAKLERFSDGEVRVQIGENVRSHDVFIIQPTCPPVDSNIFELLVMIDAIQRSSAARITAVMPYFGYSRQDWKKESRVPITAELMARLLKEAGANRFIFMDLHSGQIMGFFGKSPVDNLSAWPVLIPYIKEKIAIDNNCVVVSPDAGGAERARGFSKRLNIGLAIMDKRRSGPNEIESVTLIGDVNGKTVIILDDMFDTSGTLVKAAAEVKKMGAKKVFGCATHPVFSGPSIKRIRDSELDSVIVTDTIPLEKKAQSCEKIIQLTVAGIIGEAIRRCHNGDSVTSLFI